jgi:hypothetical protein
MIKHGDFIDFPSQEGSINTYLVVKLTGKILLVNFRGDESQPEINQTFPTQNDLDRYITQYNGSKNTVLSPEPTKKNIELTGDDCRFLISVITGRNTMIPGSFAIRAALLLNMLNEISNVQPPQAQQ